MIGIKLLSRNHETIARFPCREQEMSEVLQKLGFPEMIPPIAYAQEIIEPKEGYLKQSNIKQGGM